MPSLIARVVRLAAILTLACAAYFSLRMAWADHLYHSGTAAGAGRALALEPDNAAYALRSGRPERAAVLQPRLAEAWIELGLSAERNGQLEQAASYLERAAAVDATYAPVWTLANFYARRRDHARFLGRQNALSGSAILDTTISRRCTGWLGRCCRILPRSLSQAPRPETCIPCCHTATACSQPAMRIKPSFSGTRSSPGPRRAVRCSPPPPAASSPTANLRGSRSSMDSTGAYPQSRVSGIRLGPPGGLRITFDGRQAERCQLLEQMIPVTAQTRYLLRFRYRTEAIPPGAGPRWRISDAVTGHEMISDAAPVSSAVDADAAVRFTTASGTRLALLALVYDRVPGTTRIAGTLQLERVTLGREP